MANIHVGTNEMKQSNAEGERDFRDTSQVRVSGNKRRKHKFPQNAQSQPTQGLSPGCAQGPPLWTLTPNKVSLHLSLSLSLSLTHTQSQRYLDRRVLVHADDVAVRAPEHDVAQHRHGRRPSDSDDVIQGDAPTERRQCTAQVATTGRRSSREHLRTPCVCISSLCSLYHTKRGMMAAPTKAIVPIVSNYLDCAP